MHLVGAEADVGSRLTRGAVHESKDAAAPLRVHPAAPRRDDEVNNIVAHGVRVDLLARVPPNEIASLEHHVPPPPSGAVANARRAHELIQCSIWSMVAVVVARAAPHVHPATHDRVAELPHMARRVEELPAPPRHHEGLPHGCANLAAHRTATLQLIGQVDRSEDRVGRPLVARVELRPLLRRHSAVGRAEAKFNGKRR